MTRTKRQAHRPMTIGGFAKATGVGIETIRYYQRRGLLDTPRRAGIGTRWYTESMVARMSFIRRAQSLGFTLGEIKDLLALAGRDCGKGKDFVRGKLLELDARAVEINEMRKQLRRYVVMCDKAVPDEPCPFLRGLSEAEIPPAP